MEPDQSNIVSPGSGVSASQKLESRRQRARQACAPCRSRKRKCDGNFPCKTCVEFEYQCFYRKTPRKGGQKSTQLPSAVASPAKSSSLANEANETELDDKSTKSETESISSDHNPFKTQAILDPYKIRYSSASSAVAFPRILGLKLNHDKAPRLHSFGWHLGIRSEPQVIRRCPLSFVNLDEAIKLSTTYWDSVHPVFGFLDRSTFDRSLQERYKGVGDPRYDCIIAGVLALGSFFSSSSDHDTEKELVRLLHEILDVESSQHAPELTHAAGWILRILYLRLASRPYTAWVASCTLMHLVECIGLHKEVQTVAIISPALPDIDVAEIEYRRRLAWLAKLLHRLLSYEFSRNEVVLDYSCHHPAEDSGFPHSLLQCVKLLPSDTLSPADGSKLTNLKEAMVNLVAVATRHEIDDLFKANLVLAVFRRLWILRCTLSQSDTKLLFATGEELTSAARSVATSLQPWWCVLASPFQYVCALIAIDSPQSLPRLESAMACLEFVTGIYPTHLTQEALDTAKHLVSLSYERKAADMRALEPFLPLNQAEGAASIIPDGSMIPTLPEIPDSAIFSWPDHMFDWGYVDQNRLEIVGE